jgi:WD40 repeat protein/beta-lactamase regulating signal transducer with metallopeptidase domain
MAPLLYAALANAVLAVPLAVLAAAAGRLCRRPALAHALWVLVLVKLLTPPLLSVPVLPAVPEPAAEEPTYPTFPNETLALSELLEPPPDAAGPPAEPQASDAIGDFETALPAAEPAPLAKAEAVASPPARWDDWVPASLSWDVLIAAAWLTGSAVWLVAALVAEARFRRLLRRARPASEAVQREALDLARRLGLRRCPPVVVLPGVVSPMLWAPGRAARLVLPSDLFDRLSAAQRTTLLAHELAHLRRRDHWVRWLELVAATLYWWHPLVCWARRELREAEEQCCDAWVLWVVPGSARTYTAAILETLDFLAGARPALPVAASGIGPAHSWRRRLTMILRGDTPRSMSGAGLLAVLGLATVLLPFLPTRAPSQPPPPVAPPAPEKPDRPPAAGVPANANNPDEALQRFRAEVEESKAQMRAAEANLKAAQARLKVAEERLAKEEDRRRSRARYVEWATELNKLRPDNVPGQPADRLGELEKKLDALLKEVQELRRSQRRSGDIRMNERNFDLDRPGTGGRELRRFQGSEGPVRSAVFSPDGKLAASASHDGSVRLWDVATGKEMHRFRGHDGAVLGVAFSPDGRRLLAGGADHGAVLWDVATGEMVHRLRGHAGPVYAVAFSPDGRSVVTASRDGSVRQWDAETGKEIRLFTLAKGPVYAVAFSPDGQRLAARTPDGGIQVWDVTQGSVLFRIQGGDNGVLSLAFAPDGRTLASGGADRATHLWDAATGREVRRLAAHGGEVRCVRFSPDGRRLLSAGDDGRVFLWDAGTGRAVAELEGGHTGRVLTVAFSPDGRLVLSGGEDGALRLWEVPR